MRVSHSTEEDVQARGAAIHADWEGVWKYGVLARKSQQDLPERVTAVAAAEWVRVRWWAEDQDAGAIAVQSHYEGKTADCGRERTRGGGQVGGGAAQV